MANKKISFNLKSIILGVCATLIMIALQYAEGFISDEFIAPLQSKFLTIPAMMILFFVICPMWALYFRALFAIVRKPYSNGPFTISVAAIISFVILLIYGCVAFLAPPKLGYMALEAVYNKIYMIAIWFALFCTVCRSSDVKDVKTEEEETSTVEA